MTTSPKEGCSRSTAHPAGCHDRRGVGERRYPGAAFRLAAELCGNMFTGRADYGGSRSTRKVAVK